MKLSTSYTAAGVLPEKLIRRKDLCVAPGGLIRPVHVQLCPTNTCNLSCPFCSCSKRERDQELSFPQILRTLDTFSALGTKAVTITGGGEPLCHSDINSIVSEAVARGIKVGLVTNGLLLRTGVSGINDLTWCRVSVSDFRSVSKLLGILEHVVPSYPRVDWAFSYVITSKFSADKFARVVAFAREHGFTHVRAVSDLLDLCGASPMESVRKALDSREIPDDLVVYQDRQTYSRGATRCFTSLLKPMVAPDGYVYPCCGVQYAIPGTEGGFPEQMRMCHINDLREFYEQRVPFNGAVCRKCYYEHYNAALGAMLDQQDHEEFV